MIGTVVGLLAFFMEHTITVMVRARLALISHAASFAAGRAESTSVARFVTAIFGTNAWAPTAAAFAVAVGTASLLAACASALVVYIAPAATGAGVSWVMACLNGVHVPELLNLSTVLVKVVGASLAVASGAPIGPEGPLVHVGAGVASLCTRQLTYFKHGGIFDAFHNDADGRDFLSAGVAAGLAAAFGAPIGGVLFSLEEASTYWSHNVTWRSLMCAAVAVFVTTVLRAATPKSGAWAGKASATILSLSGSTGVIPMSDGMSKDSKSNSDVLSENQHDVFSYFLWELPSFALLAALAAVLGAVLTRASATLAPLRPRKNYQKVLEAGLVTGVCAAIPVVAAALLGACSTKRDEMGDHDGSSPAVPETSDGVDYVFGLSCPKGKVNDLGTLLLGLRDDIISELLSSSSDFTPSSIAIALLILLTTIPFACDCSFPAGLFMPTIAWGAMLGSLWGVMVRAVVERVVGEEIANLVTPGSYAVVGAASALAGMFRSSISLVVIMVEGTGRVGALMPLLLGVAVANLVGPKVHDESFYESQLRAKGVPFLRPHHAHAPKKFQQSSEQVQNDFCVQTTVGKLIMTPAVCLLEKASVKAVTDALLFTTHNGFPVVRKGGFDGSAYDSTDDGTTDVATHQEPVGPLENSETSATSGKLVGFVLRSQLMVLLARREFAENHVSWYHDQVVRSDNGSDSGDTFVELDEEHVVAVDEEHVDALSEYETVSPNVLANDAAMRTFHHRHRFGDRGVSCSAEAVQRLGLCPEDYAKHLDLTNYMKIAPLAVQRECSAWRAAGYFRSAGLRHLPVVDVENNVVGVLTRRDLVPGFSSLGCERDEPTRVEGIEEDKA